MEDNPDKRKLKVLDEEERTEEVLRLGDKKGPVQVKRAPLPPAPELAPRLEKVGGVEEFDRRSIEPDIDAIMSPGESGSLGGEMDWMSSEEKKPVPYGWFVLIFLLVVGLAATSAMLIFRSSSSDVEVAKQAVVERIEENREDEAREQTFE